MIKSKSVYEKNKDHASTIADLKKFSKPNLDDGNRFFEDNLILRNKYNEGISTASSTGFRPYQTRKAEAVVQVTGHVTQNSRSYR